MCRVELLLVTAAHMRWRQLETEGVLVSHHRFALVSSVFAAASFFSISTEVTAQAASPHQYPTLKPLTSATRPGADTTQTTVRTATTRVGGTTEKILVDASGLPLYTFGADTARHSNVSGALAQLWPPLLSAKPSASGVPGKLLSVKQSGGRQVTYNGHFLYTFIDDTPGHVTGQGVSNFFVATPHIRAVGDSTKGAKPAASSSHGYGY
jgi:predicted lipoprotein with Yx(FWY)xxD motif